MLVPSPEQGPVAVPGVEMADIPVRAVSFLLHMLWGEVRCCTVSMRAVLSDGGDNVNSSSRAALRGELRFTLCYDSRCERLGNKEFPCGGSTGNEAL